MKIKLDSSEQSKIRDYAERMLEHKGRESSFKQSNYDDLTMDLMGYTGEYIVHKYFGMHFNWEFEKKKVQEDIIILYQDKALGCDIKSSFIADELRVPKWLLDQPDIDAFILVRVERDFSGGEILGIISKKKFKELARRKGKSFYIDSLVLSPIEDTLI
jgi:hypothetical protein